MRNWNPFIGRFRAHPEKQLVKLGKKMDELLAEMLELSEEGRERQIYQLQYIFHEWHPLVQELITVMCKKDAETSKEWKRLLDTASINITSFNTNKELQGSWSKASTLISKLSNQEIANTISRILSFVFVLLENRDNTAFAKKIVKNTMFYSFDEMRGVFEAEKELNKQDIQAHNDEIATQIQQEQKQKQKLNFIE